MIQPYNTTKNRITKENSMFNYLPINYNSHQSIDHIKHIYDTTMILQMEIPTEPYTDNLTEAIIEIENQEFCKKTGLIKNECYYDARVKFKQKKTIKDVFKYLYEN